MTEKIFISPERHQKFRWNFQERCNLWKYLKSQKAGLHQLFLGLSNFMFRFARFSNIIWIKNFKKLTSELTNRWLWIVLALIWFSLKQFNKELVTFSKLFITLCRLKSKLCGVLSFAKLAILHCIVSTKYVKDIEIEK